MFIGRRAVVRLVVALVLACGAWSIAGDLTTPRTTAPAAAKAIRAGYTAGAVVAYCPDELGPPVARLLPAAFDQVTYPDFRRPELVDFRDYEARIAAADPRAFAAELLRRAGSHDVWLVWNDASTVSGPGCQLVRRALLEARPGGREVAARAAAHVETTEAVYLFPAPSRH